MAYPKPIQHLIDLFTKFPGIGPRQAARFAFFLVKNTNSFLQELIKTLQELKETIGFCEQCFRTTELPQNSSVLNVAFTPLSRGKCNICIDTKRDAALIAVVEKESDMQNLEKTGAYQGLYHILGGVLSPLDSESPKRLHLKHLYERIKTNLDGSDNNYEVILATNSTTEGDMTALYIERVLAPLQEQYPKLKISRLGRGLSLGSELEYADEMTIKNALTNRK